MRTLLLDNYDSFTYNLFQLLAEVNGEEPIVVRNDVTGWDELSELRFDNVVLSPGPGRPEHPNDFGVCTEAIRRSTAPLLGVCLGHQGLAWTHGADVANSPEPMHGRISTIVHDGSPLFAGIPHVFRAVRYHSLCIGHPIPGELQPIAWTRDGMPMAIAHRERPQWGLQFHPESICTEHGRRLIANFRDLTARLGAGRGARRKSGSAEVAVKPATRQRRAERQILRLKMRRLDRLHDAERAFAHIYGESREAFWLDSSRPDEHARFSFVGAPGPLGASIAYDVASGEVRVRRGGVTEVFSESIFDYLRREMRRLRLRSDELPFDFNGGFVGYFGYELKADCDGSRAHESGSPDAAFMLADRLIAFDHLERRTYLLCLVNSGGDVEGERWMEETSRRLASLPSLPPAERCRRPDAPVEFRLHRSHERYLHDIAVCKRHLTEGNTYEVCLTNTISAKVAPDPLPLYRRLRRLNPAPFSAYLRFGEVAVLSSSPERFLRVGRDRRVEAKPIKGTVHRGRTGAEDARLLEALRRSEKDRAENLMITDLLRNDLGSVCEIGTVHVSDLMQVETYQTVHQLVSTVRGVLREESEASDCIRACFPAGSMTGAPKRRTMEIIDELEGEARGIYSGAIGYLGLSGGCDLAVVIRTIVADGHSTSIGAGGAIVMQSDPEEEFEEMLLKARAPLWAIDPGSEPRFAGGRGGRLGG